jgi:hypothetical protein
MKLPELPAYRLIELSAAVYQMFESELRLQLLQPEPLQ